MPDIRKNPINEVAWKASHNSYDRDGHSLAAQLSHDPAEPHQHGCRGLELDIHQADGTREFWVAHTWPGDAAHRIPFSKHLDDLAAWSAGVAHAHDPVTITVDLKKIRGKDGSWITILDDYLRAHFDEDRIFKPGHFAGHGATLVAAVNALGWPTVEELQGKFLFVLSGTEKRKKEYAAQAFQRVCFADRKIAWTSVPPSASVGNRVFLNFALKSLSWLDDVDDGTGGIGDADDMFDHIVNRTRYITRGYGLNKQNIWKSANQLGVNICATNETAGKKWAKVGVEPFAPRKFRGLG